MLTAVLVVSVDSCRRTGGGGGRRGEGWNPSREAFLYNGTKFVFLFGGFSSLVKMRACRLLYCFIIVSLLSHDYCIVYCIVH